MQAPITVELPIASRLNYTSDEIPSWLRLRYIGSGYRANVDFSDCLRSLFYLHNETVPIWTHLVPALVFGWLAISFLFSGNRHSLLFANLCASFTVVFLASVFMHTFNAIDEDWNNWTLGLDWGAIAFATYGGGYTLATLAYYHDTKRQELWKIWFAVPCSIFASISSWSGFHQCPQGIKTLLVLLLVLPVIVFGFDIRQRLPEQQLQAVLQVLKGPALLLAIGVMVYANEFPEKQFQDINFDISRGHHLFHHLWSTGFAFLYLRNTWEWAQQIDDTEKERKQA